MENSMTKRVLALFVATVAILVSAHDARAQDSGAGQTLWNNNGCVGCHALSAVQARIIARAPSGMSLQKALDALNAAIAGTTLAPATSSIVMVGFAALTPAERQNLAAYIAGLPALAPQVSYAPTGGPQFPATAVGATSSQTVTITNTGSAALVFAVNNAVTIATGGDAADFRVTSSSCPGVTLQPGVGNCTINVSFQPLAGAATTRTASVGLAHNASGGSSLVPMLGIVAGASGGGTPPPTGSANPPSSGGGGAEGWQGIALLLLLALTRMRRHPLVRQASRLR